MVVNHNAAGRLGDDGGQAGAAITTSVRSDSGIWTPCLSKGPDIDDSSSSLNDENHRESRIETLPTSIRIRCLQRRKIVVEMMKASDIVTDHCHLAQLFPSLPTPSAYLIFVSFCEHFYFDDTNGLKKPTEL